MKKVYKFLRLRKKLCENVLKKHEHNKKNIIIRKECNSFSVIDILKMCGGNMKKKILIGILMFICFLNINVKALENEPMINHESGILSETVEKDDISQEQDDEKKKQKDNSESNDSLRVSEDSIIINKNDEIENKIELEIEKKDIVQENTSVINEDKEQEDVSVNENKLEEKEENPSNLGENKEQEDANINENNSEEKEGNPSNLVEDKEQEDANINENNSEEKEENPSNLVEDKEQEDTNINENKLEEKEENPSNLVEDKEQEDTNINENNLEEKEEASNLDEDKVDKKIPIEKELDANNKEEEIISNSKGGTNPGIQLLGANDPLEPTRGETVDEIPTAEDKIIFSYDGNEHFIEIGESVDLGTLIDLLKLSSAETNFMNNIISVDASDSTKISVTKTGNNYTINSFDDFSSQEYITITTTHGTYQVIVREPFIPMHTKQIHDNGNGTYELSLSVTGAAEVPTQQSRANVLIVYDTSSSMESWYAESATGSYGHDKLYPEYNDSNGYYPLYKYDNNRYVKLLIDENYDGKVYKCDNNGRNCREYDLTSHQRFSTTRASQAEVVLHDFVTQLYNHQTADIEVALVGFAGGPHGTGNPTNTIKSWTTSANRNQIINLLADEIGEKKLSYVKGTNYEAALKQALTELNIADKDKTYVIFVTDGQPSQSEKSNNITNDYGDNHSGHQRMYEDAIDSLKDVVEKINGETLTETTTDNKTEFYGIYAFGREDDFLDDMVYYAHYGKVRTPAYNASNNESYKTDTTNVSDYYFNASNASALTDAFDKILGNIVKALGINNVSIDDGTTKKATLTSGTDLELLDIDEESFTYWMSKKVDLYSGESTYEYQTERIDRVNGKTFTIYITDDDPTDNRVRLTYTRPSDVENGIIEEGEFSFDTYVTGYVHNNILTVQWKKEADGGHSPNLFFGQEPLDARVEDGAVLWDIVKGNQPLLNGVTYTVKFNVWKTQRVFDLIADLENEKISYEDLLPSSPKKELAGLSEYIIRSCSGDNCSYTLRTNTTATLSYMDSRYGTQQFQTNYINPNGIVIAKEPISLSKNWVNILDSREGSDVTIILYQQQLPDTDKETGVVTTYDPVRYMDLTLKKPNWKIDNVTISTGLMTIDYEEVYIPETDRIKLVAKRDENGKEIGVKILDKGYDYFFTEDGNDSYNWQLVAETLHPMVINGTLTELIKMNNNVLSDFILDENMENKDGYHIPIEMINDPTIKFMTSNRGFHFVRLEEGGDVYLINEVSTIDFKTNLAAWPSELLIRDENDKVTPVVEIALVDKLNNEYDSFFVEYDENNEDNYNIYYYTGTETERTKVDVGTVYSYFERHNEWLNKYDEQGGLINYHLVAKGVSNTGLNPTSSEYNRLLKLITEDYFTYVYQNNDIEPAISATNYRRSNLNIKKEVDGEQLPETTKFTFDINIYDPGNVIKDDNGNLVLDYLYFSVWDSKTNGYVELDNTIGSWSKEIVELDDERAIDDTGWTGYYYGNNDINNTLTIQLNTYQNLRFINLTTDAIYKVVEVMPQAGFLFDGATGTYNHEVNIDNQNKNNVNVSVVDGSVTIDGARIWDSSSSNIPESRVIKIYKLIDDKTQELIEEINVDVEQNYLNSEHTKYDYRAKYIFNNLSSDTTYIIKEVVDGVDKEITVIRKDFYNVLDINNDDIVSGKIGMTNSAYTLTMKNRQVVNIIVTKAWSDNANQDGTKPRSVRVQLYKGGVAEGEAVTLSEANSWTHTWSDLDKYSDGEAIIYELKEVVEGLIGGLSTINEKEEGKYYYTVSQNNDGSYTITNTYVPLTTNVTVTKAWSDNANQDGTKPRSIRVQLYKGGVAEYH